MKKTIQAVRGMNDILPESINNWHYVEKILKEVLDQFSYQEIRFPILEKSQLFKRSIGEVTDIVEKEMYTFDDRNGESLSLRPEGTAGCIRAGIENGILYNQIRRLWYMGPMYRYERPQKGRYRQFYHLGAEAFGMSGPDIDAELIAMNALFWKRLGIEQKLTLEINTLGRSEERLKYRDVLVQYFKSHDDDLDEDSKRRLVSNPLRILDSKNKSMQTLILDAPALIDYLDENSRQHFETLQSYLKAMNIPYTVNLRLVRGLDYYAHTVFEWVTSELGAQNTVCAGGRYDGLVEQLGGQSTPGVGFAVGLERLIDLVNQQECPLKPPRPHAYWVLSDGKAREQALCLMLQLREKWPELRLQMDCTGTSFKSQFKKADKSGAECAVVIGETEATQRRITIKYLREDKPQECIQQSDIESFFRRML